MLEKIPLSDPPSSAELSDQTRAVDELIETALHPRITPLLIPLREPVQLVGTGGTSTILARMEQQLDHFDRALIERTSLSHETVQRQNRRLWSLPLHERRNITGLPPNRADVILPGVLIFERVMSAFLFGSLRVSTRGIRFAALMDEE